MPRRCKKGFWCGIMAGCLFHTLGLNLAWGDEYHNNNFTVGERPSGMAGAYTALSDDAAGLYYNPAGTAFGPNQVTASIYAFVKSTTTYNNVFGKSDWTKDSNEFVPGFFGITHRLDFGTVGLSVAVIDSATSNQNQDVYDITVGGQRFWQYGRINYNAENRQYNFGPSLAYSISPELSLGATVYVQYKKQKESTNQSFSNQEAAGYDLLWENVNIDETEWGLRPILGVLWKPSPGKISLGLSCSKAFVLSRDYTFQYMGAYQSSLPNARPSGAIMGIQESHDRREYPTVLTLGVGFTPSPSWLLSWDLSYYTATSRQDQDTPASTLATRSFFNSAIGTEVKFSETWIVRGGLFTNLANVNSGDIQDDAWGEAIDLFGATISLTYKQKNFSMTLGTSYSAGNGKARLGSFGFGDLRDSGSLVDAQKSQWITFLSASF